MLGRLTLQDWPGSPAATVLGESPLARGYYEPEMRPTFDARIGVTFCPFRWDESAPWIWLMATVGLSVLTQAPPAAPHERMAQVSPYLELCAAFAEPDVPAWADFRNAWERGSLGTFPGVPSTIANFALVAQDFASWIAQDHDAFAIFDHVENASIATGLPSALLIPPIPELLYNGISPFDARGVRANVEMADWADIAKLRAAGDHAFVQLAPLHADELDAAKWAGRAFFARALLPSPDEGDLDASVHIVNLRRPSRRLYFT